MLLGAPSLIVWCCAGSQQSPAPHGVSRGWNHPAQEVCVEGKDRASTIAVAENLVPPASLHSSPGPHMRSHTNDMKHKK